MKSVQRGYNQQEEDRLLEKVRWKEDGYRLFSISTFAGSSSGGWFAPMSESNALFLTTELWQELGGYDELPLAGWRVGEPRYLRSPVRCLTLS